MGRAAPVLIIPIWWAQWRRLPIVCWSPMAIFLGSWLLCGKSGTENVCRLVLGLFETLCLMSPSWPDQIFSYLWSISQATSSWYWRTSIFILSAIIGFSSSAICLCHWSGKCWLMLSAFLGLYGVCRTSNSCLRYVRRVLREWCVILRGSHCVRPLW